MKMKNTHNFVHEKVIKKNRITVAMEAFESEQKGE